MIQKALSPLIPYFYVQSVIVKSIRKNFNNDNSNNDNNENISFSIQLKLQLQISLLQDNCNWQAWFYKKYYNHRKVKGKTEKKIKQPKLNGCNSGFVHSLFLQQNM